MQNHASGGETRPHRRRDGTPGTVGSPREARRRRAAAAAEPRRRRLKKVRTRLGSAADQPRGTTVPRAKGGTGGGSPEDAAARA